MTTQTLSPPELNTLQLEIDGEIGTLTFDRPDVFNAMSPEMILEMTTVFSWLADQAPLRGLIITGSGRAFCAGGDINTFKAGVEDDSIDLPSQVRRGADALHTAIVDLRRIPYPVIAAVNGAAAGAGFSLALACDIRIASSEGFFTCAYGNIGASPDGGMTYFLPRIVSPSRAMEILLNDPNIGAENALAEGIVTEVVEPGELLNRAREKAEKLAAKAPFYVKMVKALCDQSIENSLTEQLQLERHGIADSMATEDLRTGVAAFFAGERPVFEGR
jgi:2-(1,2-epoxy-1,2-dihydrophenyl)acetyl-CoA isomerase